jgi:hypothetical protein
MEPIRVNIVRPPTTGGIDAAANMIRTVPGVLSVRRGPGKDELLVEAADTVDPDDVLTAVEKTGAAASLIG